MPVFSLLLKGKGCIEHRFTMRKHYHLKYLKLLHVHTNIFHNHLYQHPGDTTAQNKPRLLLAKLSFLGLDQYENILLSATGAQEEHSFVVLGACASTTDHIVSRDLYKVLIDRPGFILNQDIVVSLHYLDEENAEVKPLVAHSDLEGSGSPTEKAFVDLVFEYEEL